MRFQIIYSFSVGVSSTCPRCDHEPFHPLNLLQHRGLPCCSSSLVGFYLGDVVPEVSWNEIRETKGLLKKTGEMEIRPLEHPTPPPSFGVFCVMWWISEFRFLATLAKPKIYIYIIIYNHIFTYIYIFSHSIHIYSYIYLDVCTSCACGILERHVYMYVYNDKYFTCIVVVYRASTESLWYNRLIVIFYFITY